MWEHDQILSKIESIIWFIHNLISFLSLFLLLPTFLEDK